MSVVYKLKNPSYSIATFYVSEKNKGNIIQSTHDSKLYYLKSAESITIMPGQRVLVSTGVEIDISAGFYAIISYNELNHRLIRVGVDIIDNSCGNINIFMDNFGEYPFKINIGDQIAKIKFIENNNNLIQFEKIEK